MTRRMQCPGQAVEPHPPSPPPPSGGGGAGQPPSHTIGIIQNSLFNVGIKEYSREGRHRGFICAWFAAWGQAARLARGLGPAATVRRDCAGGWFIIIRFHTSGQSWR